MTLHHSIEQAGMSERPPRRPAPAAFGGVVRRFRSTIDLALKPIKVGDAVALGEIPDGALFVAGVAICTVGLGLPVLNIGLSQKHETNVQYGEGLRLPMADAPRWFGVAKDDGADLEPRLIKTHGGKTMTFGASEGNDVDTHMTARSIFLSVGVADLPPDGTLVVDLLFSTP